LFSCVLNLKQIKTFLYNKKRTEKIKNCKIFEIKNYITNIFTNFIYIYRLSPHRQIEYRFHSSVHIGADVWFRKKGQSGFVYFYTNAQHIWHKYDVVAMLLYVCGGRRPVGMSVGFPITITTWPPFCFWETSKGVALSVIIILITYIGIICR